MRGMQSAKIVPGAMASSGVDCGRLDDPADHCSNWLRLSISEPGGGGWRRGVKGTFVVGGWRAGNHEPVVSRQHRPAVSIVHSSKRGTCHPSTGTGIQGELHHPPPHTHTRRATPPPQNCRKIVPTRREPLTCHDLWLPTPRHNRM